MDSKKNPRVSIVIPTTGERDLQPTLMSIAKQTFKDYEIITQYDRAKRGPVWACNQGAKNAKGEYLFFCDDDVVLYPDTLDHLVEALDATPEVEYIYGDYDYDGHPHEGSGTHHAIPFDPEKLCNFNYISTMSLMRKRAFDAVGGFEDKYPHDWYLWRKMLEKGFFGAYMPETLFYTTFDNDSLTAKMIEENETS